jgi:hypothetical protein
MGLFFYLICWLYRRMAAIDPQSARRTAYTNLTSYIEY